MTMEQITIRAFRAVDEPELCRQYAEEHAKVLSDIGVDQVVKQDESWMHAAGTIVIAAFHDEHGMVAGVRVQKRDSGPFPMEGYLSALEDNFTGFLFPMDANPAEMCGLWNAHRFAGRGIPPLLLTAAVSISAREGLKALVCFAADYMKPKCEELGFVTIDHFGDNGSYQFPLPGIRSYIMLQSNIIALSGIPNTKRKEILGLRLNPSSSIEKETKLGRLAVKFDLVLDCEVQYEPVMLLRRRFAA